jgi:phosphonate transport system substrate-binding protein
MTEGYTPHALAAHPRVLETNIVNISNAMMAMNGDVQVKALLTDVNFSSIIAAANEYWDDVRALNITLLDYLLYSKPANHLIT